MSLLCFVTSMATLFTLGALAPATATAVPASVTVPRSTVMAVARPAAPPLASPANGATARSADIAFRWEAVTGATGYDLRLSRQPGMRRNVTIGTTDTTATRFLERGLWYWKVRTRERRNVEAGSWSAVRSVNVQPRTDVYAPTRPGPMRVQSVGQTSAVVQFGTSRDDASVVRYLVQADGRTTHTTTRHRDVRVPLRCGRTYAMTAVAIDEAGNRSPASPRANLRTHACADTQAPPPPTTVRAGAPSYDRVRLEWPVAGSGEQRASGYVVSRDGAVLGGTTTTSYVARNLQPDTRYVFAVRSRDPRGNLSRATEVAFRTPKPPQATGNVRAFVLHTDTASINDAQAHYRSLDWIYPTYFSMDHDGQVSGTGQPRQTEWFQVRGVRVLPRFHSEDPAVIEAIVTDPTGRSTAAEAIAAVVAEGGYDGANIDFEMVAPTTGVDGLTVTERKQRLRDGYTAFALELEGLLQEQGRLLSLDVAVNWCSTYDRMTRDVVYCSDSTHASTAGRARPFLYDVAKLAPRVDELWLLSWGLHWATSEPGAVADAQWLRAVTAYYVDLYAGDPALLSKLTLGTHLYGMDWSYVVTRTDTVRMPGGTVPPAPTCANSGKAARPRYSYAGDTTAGTLTIDWICILQAATMREHHDVLAVAGEFGSPATFDPNTAEMVLTGADPSFPGAQRELWFVNRRSIAARAEIAADAGMRLGLWRLGREDQQVWDLTALGGAS